MGETMQVSDRIGRRLKLHDLHVLMAVVQAGSMGKAAAQLNTTQPAVSRSIAELEKTIGMRLLDRTSRGVEPTIYAEAILRRGHAVFDELKQAIKDIEFLADPTVGEVRVLVPEFICTALVPALIERLADLHPGICVRVSLLDVTTLGFPELRRRDVDLVVARVPRSFADDDFTTDIVLDDPNVVVAGTRSQWARRRHITLADLALAPWILFPNTPFLDATFAAHGLSLPPERVTTTSVLLRNELVAGGRFVSLLSRSAFRRNVCQWPIRALPIDLRVTPAPITIVTLKERTLGPVAQLFVRELHAVARSFAK
jgi:DNA-binding transcriptional LysR family regulator